MLLRLAFLLLAFSASVFSAAAQTVTASAQVTDWPLSTIDKKPVEARYWRGYDILPFIDALTLTMAVTPQAEAPEVSASVVWRMGREGIKRGRRVPAAELPAGVHLVAFVLRGDVIQNGARVAGLTLAIDSTRLAPGETLVLDPLTDWGTLFDDVGAEESRRIVEAGFTLENLQLARAAFTVFPTGTSAAPDAVPAPSDRRSRDEDVYRTVYVTDVWVDVAWNLGWLFGPDPYPGRRESARALAPRGETGRTTRETKKKEDEEEDDSGELLPAALMVGAGVAALAVFGGTAGYVAQSNEPIGVAAGFLRKGGGVMLQASANPAALGMEKRDESMSAQIIGFAGGYAIQPAVGLGLRYHERAGAMQVDPAVTLGAVWRGGPVSALVGYEVIAGRAAFGLLFSWKTR